MIKIKYFEEVTSEFEMLSNNMNSELDGMGTHFRDVHAQFCTLAGIKDVMIAYKNGVPAGCASMKYYDEESYEVKRVYVKGEYRKNSIGEKLMEELERKANEKGIKRLILETGKDKTAAIGLYRKLGYETIENFGQYKKIETSVCMGKGLTLNSPSKL